MKVFNYQIESLDNIVHPDGRISEVAMVLTNSDGSIWALTKEHYPKGLFRIPTGGVKKGESLDKAFRRELHEETGLRVDNPKMIGIVGYDINFQGRTTPFTSYIFLADIGEKVPVPLDKSEKISEFKALTKTEIAALSDKWKEHKQNTSDWGRFRAILHEIVPGLLDSHSS